MRAARYITLVWPGLPWLWLRGSLMGLALAAAFAVAIDVAVVTTWVWCELVELPVAIGIWAAAAAILVVGTVSAVQAFPPPIPLGRDAATDVLFVAARDAYLARDWTGAEAKVRALLVRAPTDGEAQLLLATLLRRVGRTGEAREALAKLVRSDSGDPWRAEIAREMSRLDGATTGPEADEEPVSLPLHAEPGDSGRRGVAA